MIEPMTPEHAEQVLAIYQAGIDEGNATFETTTPDWPTFSEAKLPDHRFVAVQHDTVLLDRRRQGLRPLRLRGRHRALRLRFPLRPWPRRRHQAAGSLIDSTEAAGIWTIQSGIFPENTASLVLHQRLGFRVIAPANASAVTTAPGGTSSSSNGEAPTSPEASLACQSRGLKVIDHTAHPVRAGADLAQDRPVLEPGVGSLSERTRAWPCSRLGPLLRDFVSGT